MIDIIGTPDEILAQVQALVSEQVPGAVCELQRYKTQIGCGVLDERGALHEISWGLKGLNAWRVKDQASALASRVRPRTRFG